MPIKQIINHALSTKIIVWHLTESIEELLSNLKLDEAQLNYFINLPKKKGLEYLGVKSCLKKFSVESKLFYNKKGKPFLKNNQFISISHSESMVCVALSNKPIGVDIEMNHPKKIENIQSKFICDDELEWISNKPNKADYLHIIWGIKEGLYKLNGGKFWNFLHHYQVGKFELIENQKIKCAIIENQIKTNYEAFYQKIENYFLVWVD
jgi:4'-phosphopantetheinyl transferase